MVRGSLPYMLDFVASRLMNSDRSFGIFLVFSRFRSRRSSDLVVLFSMILMPYHEMESWLAILVGPRGYLRMMAQGENVVDDMA